MKHWMMIACMIVLAAAGTASAQQGVEDTREWKEPRRVKVGGAGGVIPSLGLFKNDEINKTLKSVGMPELNSDPMVLLGGEGYGYIMFLPNLRIGGFGTGGKKSASMLAGSVKKEVDYSVSYGGFLMDYVVPVTNRLDIAGGFTIGGGTIKVEMSRDDGGYKKWGDLWTEYGGNGPTFNVNRSLAGTFVAFNPHLNIEYSVLSWMQVRVGAGYPILFNSTWELNGSDEIQNVPSNLTTDGVTINGGLMFGFFN